MDHKILRPGLLVLGMLLLVACGSPQTQSVFKGEAYQKAVNLAGDVRSGSRTITAGHLIVADFNGQNVAATDWTTGNGFSISLPAGTLYPVLLSAHLQGADGGQILRMVVVKPEEGRLSVTERSTLIADKAIKLGGYTPDNVMTATLDSSGPSNPMGGGPHGESTQHYGGWH